jgi:hypothetical protein
MYGKSMDNVIFFVTNNCNTNKSIARITSKLLIGCASHRLNLAAKAFYQEFESILENINSIMKKLNTLKRAARLRLLTDLEPVTRNSTRWSSTFAMVKRFIEIKEYIDFNDVELILLSPTVIQIIEINDLILKLSDFQDYTKALQDVGLRMCQVRIIFDELMEHYQVTSSYLSPTADIVFDQTFESGIVKIQNDRISNLTSSEHHCMEVFKKDNSETIVIGEEPPKKRSFTEIAYNKKNTTSNSTSQYTNINWIPPTSHSVERLFNRVKLTLGDLKQSMDSATLENVMYLNANRNLWNVMTVEALIERNN